MRLRRGTRVLDRGDGTLHVGIRPGLVMRGLNRAERAFVERLETARTVSVTQQRRYRDLLTTLAAANLVEPPAPPASTLGIHDAGPIGLSIGMSAARDGWAVRFIDDGQTEFAPPGTYSAGVLAATRAGAACATVRAQSPIGTVAAGEGPADARVIISSGAPGLDAALPLMASDVAHLFVTIDERGACVGPLVEPGLSACGWCDGLTRAGRDSAWPLLALQLGAPRPDAATTTPDVMAQVTALACAALGAWRTGHARRWHNSVWNVTAYEPMSRSPLMPHPRCGCGAAGPMGDDLAARRARMPRGEVPRP